jgi:hypothetical protein
LVTEIQFHARDEITAFVRISKSIQGSSRSLIQWVPGALLPGVKRLKRKADNTTLKSRKLEFVDVYHHASYTSPEPRVYIRGYFTFIPVEISD